MGLIPVVESAGEGMETRLLLSESAKAMSRIETAGRLGAVVDGVVTGGETLYTAFCPMAFDFKGGKWIQRGTEINNPYFGSQMLRCGDIQETLLPAADQNEGHDHDR